MTKEAALNSVEEVAVNSTVRSMLRGNLAAVNSLPPALRAAAQARYTARSEATTRATIERQRVNPLHAGPTPGLH
jgi:hypothetical protein